MPSTPSSSGRAHWILPLLGLVAAGVLLVLVVKPFGSGDEIQRTEQDEAARDLRTEEVGTAAARGTEGGGALVGRYQEADLGAVRVRLLKVADRAPFPGQPLTLVARTGTPTAATSGPDGIALFERLAPARGYRLEVGGEGHAPVTLLGVHVVSGQVTDLGDVVLGENLVLRGRVVDGTGRALAGSSVAVYTRTRGMLAEGFLSSIVGQATDFPAPLEEVLSDEGGWFTFTSLRDGTYRLEARHPGYTTRTESDVVVSQARPARDMTIVLGEGATVEGTVRGEDGPPIAGAKVVALKDTGSRFFGAGATLERDLAVADASGRYTIDTLVQGMTYRFGVLAPGYAPVFEMSGTEIQAKRQTRDFTLARGGSIQGKVTKKGDGTPIADAEVLVAVGRMAMGPPTGRRGGASGAAGRQGGGGEGGEEAAAERAATGRTRTDAEGRFLLENILPGPVMTAQVRASAFVPYAASLFTGNGWGEVTPGGMLEVVVELEGGGVIEGAVLDAATRTPVVGAQVAALPREQPWRVFMAGSSNAQTDASGRYRLVGVEPGTYGIAATAPGYAASDVTAEDTGVTLPDAGATAMRDVLLARAGSVTGRVTDSRGEPVAGARVRTRIAPRASGARGGRGGPGGGMGQMRAFLPGGTGAGMTDQDGRYRIDDVGAEERWIATAEADDYVMAESEPFAVSVGEAKEVDLVLSGGGSVEGRVVDEQGRFVEGARVQMGHLPADRAGQVRLSAWETDRYLDSQVWFTDADGRFRADHIPPGTAVVKVEREGYVTYYKRNLVVRADDTVAGYTVALQKGDVMEGVVKSAGGAPVRDAWIAVSSSPNPGTEEDAGGTPQEDVEPRLSGQTDEVGRFRIENIVPGRYSVVVWFAPGYETWARAQNPKAIRRDVPSSATDVEFRLDATPPAAGPGFPGPGGGGGPRPPR